MRADMDGLRTQFKSHDVGWLLAVAAVVIVVDARALVLKVRREQLYCPKCQGE